MNNKNITTEEISSLLFYQGNTTDVRCGNIENKAFYSIQNGYEAINMLLFEGIENEEARMLAEERNVSVELLNHIDELLNVYCNLYSAMCKYTYFSKNSEGECLHTYRYDRVQSLTALGDGRTPSFFSTSEKEETDDYFKQKSGLLIFEVMATSDTIHIDMNKVLGGENDFADEREILFPPNLKAILEMDRLSEKEKSYIDRDGNSPVGKYRVYLSNSTDLDKPIMSVELMESVKGRILQEIHNSELLENVRQVWESYNHGKKPDEMHIEKYCHWKKELQKFIKLRYGEIYRDIFHDNREKRFDLLCESINAVQIEANRKREQYEKELLHQGIVLALLRGGTAFLIGISLLGVGADTVFELYIKVAALLMFVISFFTNEIFKGTALHGKLRQRTETFLRLDELERDIRFEEYISAEKLNSYIERYKRLIQDDNRWCEENTESLVELSDRIVKSEIKEEVEQIIKP